MRIATVTKKNVNDYMAYKLEKEKDDTVTKEKYLHNDIEWCGFDNYVRQWCYTLLGQSILISDSKASGGACIALI